MIDENTEDVDRLVVEDAVGRDVEEFASREGEFELLEVVESDVVVLMVERGGLTETKIWLVVVCDMMILSRNFGRRRKEPGRMLRCED